VLVSERDDPPLRLHPADAQNRIPEGAETAPAIRKRKTAREFSLKENSLFGQTQPHNLLLSDMGREAGEGGVSGSAVSAG